MRIMATRQGAASRAVDPGTIVMQTTKRLWLGLGALLVTSFGLLLWMGREIYHQAPPVPPQPAWRRSES